MIESLSNSTIRQYEGVYKAWWQLCKQQQWEVFNPREADVIKFFMHQLQTKQITYGSFNTYRSALSIILECNITNNPNIKRLLKGIFRLRPPARRYNYIWDPQIVISFLEHKYPNGNLSLNQLSKKTITLLALITGHRIQTLARIRVDNIIISTDEIQILISDHIKSSRMKAEQPCLLIPYFREKPEICAGSALIAYINKTISIRNETQDFLFLSTRRPFKTATTSTLSRWIRQTLEEAGIDTKIFSGYSTRHAATSAASRNGVTLDIIRRTAGWSNISEVFARLYNCPLRHNTLFAKSVLSPG